jgi:hypothetical protein
VSRLGEDHASRISFPAARDEGLLVETVGDETVVYDLESKEAHCLKPLAATVFAHADGRTSAEELAALAGERLGEPVTESQVQEAILQLNATGLLDESLRVHNGGFSRRQMIGKGAAAGGALVGATLITSVMAPVASATQTVLPPGACCGPLASCNGDNHRCSSDHCCQNDKECNKCKCTDGDNSCSTSQCNTTSNVGDCPSVLINGVMTPACATTGTSSGFKCCYPDPADTSVPPRCCRNFQTASNNTPCT